MVHWIKWIPHSIFWSVWQFPKSTRSEDTFFFPVLFSLLCVYEMLARPTLGLISIENVLKLHAPLPCTAVHNFYWKCSECKPIFVRNLFSYVAQYKCCYLIQNCMIFWEFWDSRLPPPQLENSTMAWACNLKNFATAVQSREVYSDVMALHSKVPSNCRPFRTCVPNCLYKTRS